MADKSFGIKELNLVSSGTPKIESLGNLNLNAVTVAISTNATVGGNLDVDGHTELDDVNISGVSTFAGITTVTGQTLFTKQLSVSGFSTFFNDVKFAGANYDALWDTSEDRLEFKDGASAVFGTGNDLEIKHSGGNTTLKNITGEFRIAGNDIRLQNQTSSTDFIKVNSTGSVVTGVLTATSFSGDGSGLTGVVGSGSGIAIKHDGAIVGTAGTIDFSTNLDVSAISGAAVTVTASSGGIPGISTTGTSNFFNVGIAGTVGIASHVHINKEAKLSFGDNPSSVSGLRIWNTGGGASDYSYIMSKDMLVLSTIGT